jgi:hypothetical protein
MRRRSLLAALGTTAALAGCLGEGARSPAAENGNEENGDESTPDEDRIRDRFNGEPTRPECEQDSETITVERGDETQEKETVATIPYPDAPSSFSDENIVEYVESFEAAYVRHDALCGSSDDIIGFAYNVDERKTLDWDGETTVVYLYYAGGATGGVDEDGNEWAADLGFRGLVYGVDETGAARVDVDGSQGRAPDELAVQLPGLLDDGEFVVTFE